MKSRTLLECTVDLAQPVPEITAVISAVLAYHPDGQAEILRALDYEIGTALAALETEETADGAGDI
ncbi:hypothetical protein EL84_25890 [Paenibacillus sp. VT-400]|uniref:hypothetical protein n=1 Tax=Paenibacillus sp. VT-400 TaxID=1495853 RepID=UPI00064A3916|nr:hypothetical protein [Paenibacillus sp. VT-400]KLU55477.1 hypothetical protein EL84_25890 [Paenibacillus sp. VT-400]